jgi:GT2 family glycosyltransferase
MRTLIAIDKAWQSQSCCCQEMAVTLSIVIVNWNAGSLLQDCVRSIEGARLEGFSLGQVVIVDNGSTDGSLDGLASTDLPLKIIKNADNKGFAAACNQGAQGSRADYLLFLNPDTRLFADSLSVPLAFMEAAQNQSVGICGIQLIDEHEEISRSCARFPTPRMFLSKIFGLDKLFPRFFQSHFLEEWGHKENREVDHVIGAFFLVRRRLFEQLSGFDERFFVYLEDLDFSLRAKESGWASYYLADARAYHKGGGTSEQVKARRLFYSLRSRILYGYKHFTPARATFLLVSTLCFEPLIRLAYSLLQGAFKSASETISCYLMLYRALPEIMKVALTR